MNKKILKVSLIIALMISVLITLSGCKDEEKSNKKENKAENNTAIENNVINNNTSNDEVQEITSELPEGSCLFVTKVTDNGDTYTLEGVIYDEYIVSKEELNKAVKDGTIDIENKTYTVKKEEDDDIEMYELYDGEDALFSIRKHEDGKYHLIRLAQISTCQRKTTKKRKIAISKDLKCENYYTEEVETVSKTFSNFKSTEAQDTTHPTPSYTFEFKNGKCSKLYVDTGL